MVIAASYMLINMRLMFTFSDVSKFIKINILEDNVILRTQNCKLNCFYVWIPKLMWNQLVGGVQLLSRWILLCQSKLHLTPSSSLQLYSLIGKWLLQFYSSNFLNFLWHLFSPKQISGEEMGLLSMHRGRLPLALMWVSVSHHHDFQSWIYFYMLMHAFLHVLVTQLILNSIKFEWLGENFCHRILFSLCYILFRFVLFNDQLKAHKGWFAPELLCSQTLPSSTTTTKSSPSDPMTTSRANQVQYHPFIYTILSQRLPAKRSKDDGGLRIYSFIHMYAPWSDFKESNK